MKQLSKPVLAAWMILLPFAAGMLVGQQITIRQFDPIVSIIENKDKPTADVVVTVEGEKTWEFTDEEMPVIVPVTEDELTEMVKDSTFIPRRLTLDGEPLSYISKRVDFDTKLEYEEEISLEPGLLESELPSFDFGDADTGLTWSSDGVLETTSVIVRGEEILSCLFMGIDLIGCRKTSRFEEGIKMLEEMEGELKKMKEIIEGIQRYDK